MAELDSDPEAPNEAEKVARSPWFQWLPQNWFSEVSAIVALALLVAAVAVMRSPDGDSIGGDAAVDALSASGSSESATALATSADLETDPVVLATGLTEPAARGADESAAGSGSQPATPAALFPEAARAVLDDFMVAFNGRDKVAWRKTLHYPHVRLASGQVAVAETAEEYATDMDFSEFARTTGWDHSAWDSVRLLYQDSEKVHFDTQFTRYNSNNEAIATYRSLYVVTHETDAEGQLRWGIKARSSFAP